jgi:hypothetical protein
VPALRTVEQIQSPLLLCGGCIGDRLGGHGDVWMVDFGGVTIWPDSHAEPDRQEVGTCCCEEDIAGSMVSGFGCIMGEVEVTRIPWEHQLLPLKPWWWYGSCRWMSIRYFVQYTSFIISYLVRLRLTLVSTTGTML